MKCPCLFLVVFCTLVTCEAQRSNNDIIWYPVEDEDGVFISLYGEKRRDAPSSKWRSHRRARYSGTEQNTVQAIPLSYDPTENQDFSFFHNINERRPGISSTLTDFEENQKKKPHKSPPRNENNLQEILNEVFDYNKYPPTSSFYSQYPEEKPANQWGSTQDSHLGQRPTTGNQWGDRPQTGNMWGLNSQRPTTGNQWESNPLMTVFPGQRPISNTGQPQTNQYGTSGTFADNQWGSSRPVVRPNEWLTTTGNTNKPNNRPNRPEGSDIFVFPDDITRNTGGTSRFTTTTTPSNLIPMDPPTMSPCERLCPVTPEFNPVCGTDAMTYTNAGRLKCAQMCGKDVKLSHHGNCGRTPFVTPLVSNNRVKKLKEFWTLSN